MTTEERFVRIERNLADTAEKLRHLAIIAEQNEIRAAANEERAAANEERAAANEERAAANEERAAQMMDTFNRMGRILQIHEQRIDSLEGRRPA